MTSINEVVQQPTSKSIVRILAADETVRVGSEEYKSGDTVMLQWRYAQINGKTNTERINLMRRTTIKHIYVIGGKLYCAELADKRSYSLDRLQKIQ